MLENNPYSLDQNYFRRRFERASASYDQASVVQREIGTRLLEKLDVIRLQPATILDLGCATGQIATGLFKRYRKARVLAADISPAMLGFCQRSKPWLRTLYPICAHAEQLPLAADSCELIVSNLVLHWCNDLDQVLRECWRVLRPNGLLLFSTYGPDTLQELRQSWRAADEQVHIHAFMDMHDIGDALIRTQFADPVMDSEYLTLTYADVNTLLKDLRDVGAVNAAIGRQRGLTGKNKFHTMLSTYEALRQNGRIPATFEVAYGHAWKPEAMRSHRRDDGSAVFPLSQLRRRS